MRNKKLTLALLMAVLAISLLLSACGGGNDTPGNSGKPENNADATTIIAEGIGHGGHGYECEFLMQEYSDGTAKVYVAHHRYDGGAYTAGPEIVFDGTLARGTDDDGDAYVTYTINSYGAWFVDENGAHINDATAAASQGSVSYDLSNAKYTTHTTNTVSNDGYTLTMAYSVFGYADISASIEMKTLGSEAATDASTWSAHSRWSATPNASDATADNEGQDDNGGSESGIVAATFFGGAEGYDEASGGTAAQVELNKDGSVSVVVGYYAPTRGSFAATYFTEAGSWTQEGDTYTISLTSITVEEEKADINDRFTAIDSFLLTVEKPNGDGTTESFSAALSLLDA